MNASTLHIRKNDKKLAALIDYVGELKEDKEYDLFSFIVCEIVGQMLSNKVRHVIVNRLTELCNNNISAYCVAKLTVQDLRSIGLSNAKSEYILNFANLVYQEDLDLRELKNLSDEEVSKKLIRIKGIGSWTVKMVLLFALHRPNVLPYEDVAFLQGYRWLYGKKQVSRNDIVRKSQKWTPYCSTAAKYLYECVNRNFIKRDNSFLKNGLE